MKLIRIILLAVTAMTLTLAGCNEDIDGKWDPMKWEVNGKKTESPQVIFDAQGGTQTLICKNYSSFWIPRQAADDDWTERDYGWMKCSIEKNRLTITVDAATGNVPLPREEEIPITAGDIFSGVTVIQK